jgi:hypothetical protein
MVHTDFLPCGLFEVSAGTANDQNRTEPTKWATAAVKNARHRQKALHFVKRSDPVRAVARFTGSNLDAPVDLGFRCAPPQAYGDTRSAG